MAEDDESCSFRWEFRFDILWACWNKSYDQNKISPSWVWDFGFSSFPSFAHSCCILHEYVDLWEVSVFHRSSLISVSQQMGSISPFLIHLCGWYMLYDFSMWGGSLVERYMVSKGEVIVYQY